jgi:hypothetical protein
MLQAYIICKRLDIILLDTAHFLAYIDILDVSGDDYTRLQVIGCHFTDIFVTCRCWSYGRKRCVDL